MSSIAAAAILIVAEREIEARGIKSSLLARGCASVHYCFSQAEALLALSSQSFDLILVNRTLEGGEGVSLATKLRSAAHANSAIIILAHETTWALALEVERSGANGLLSSALPFETLLDSLDNLLRNPDRFIFIGERGVSNLLDELTTSEKEVLAQLALGLTTREIAKHRHNSEATIKSHLTAIYRKLGARNRVEAVAHLNNR